MLQPAACPATTAGARHFEWLAALGALVLCLVSLPARAQPAVVGEDSMARRMQACIPCHGKEGRAAPEGYLPRIAGKPGGYLFNQLSHFREGRRTNTAMSYLVQHLSDAYLQEIADYFAGMDLPYPPPAVSTASAALLARGETLARKGDPARDLPACVQCHGESLTGVLPALPGLLGLPRDYIAGQIGAWKSGQRRAAAPDCMATVVERLSADDIGAVAAWLSAQPVAQGGKPSPRLAARLPLRCGSIGP